MMGYLRNESKTSEAFDEDGWLRSGDIGKIDEDGFISVTGRIKGRSDGLKPGPSRRTVTEQRTGLLAI